MISKRGTFQVQPISLLLLLLLSINYVLVFSQLTLLGKSLRGGTI